MDIKCPLPLNTRERPVLSHLTVHLLLYFLFLFLFFLNWFRVSNFVFLLSLLSLLLRLFHWALPSLLGARRQEGREGGSSLSTYSGFLFLHFDSAAGRPAPVINLWLFFCFFFCFFFPLKRTTIRLWYTTTSPFFYFVFSSSFLVRPALAIFVRSILSSIFHSFKIVIRVHRSHYVPSACEVLWVHVALVVVVVVDVGAVAATRPVTPPP